MSLNRWGLAPLLTGFLLVACTSAEAGELDRRLAQPQAQSVLTVGSSDLGLDTPSAKDSVALADLAQITDFHPETDRWTDRNNRIRVSLWTGLWAPSGEFDIDPTAAVGFRISWEVPGFIGIRWDSGFVGWAELEVKSGAGPGRLDADVDGVFHSHHLSLGIFNPELSIGGLSFWAGFGGGLWLFDFDENDVFTGATPASRINVDWSDSAISGHIFVELDYKVADIFHIGFMMRPHLVLADWTDEGRFYAFNNVDQSSPQATGGLGTDGRNNGIFDDVGVIMEITVTFSVLF